MSTANKPRKRLPWTYYEALGWGGKRFDESRARGIVDRVGLEAASEQGDTPLTVAAALGRVQMVLWLLSQGADVEDVAPHERFKTALGAAAYGKRPEVVEVLIAAGADLEARDGFGNTPLANAFVNRFTDPRPVASLLLRHGAAVTDQVRQLGEDWDAVAFRGLIADHSSSAGPDAPTHPPTRYVSVTG